MTTYIDRDKLTAELNQTVIDIRKRADNTKDEIRKMGLLVYSDALVKVSDDLRSGKYDA